MAYTYLTPARRTRAGFGAGGGLFDLNRQINRLFDDLFDQDDDGGTMSGRGMNAPAMELHQTDERVELTAELPGVTQDDIELTVEDGVLTLSGEKQSERTDEERGYSERSYGRFERRVTLPGDIDEDHVSADFENGVLTVTLPRTEQKTNARRIAIGNRDAGTRTIENTSEEQDKVPENA